MNAIASEKAPEAVSAGAAPSAVNSQKNNSPALVPPDPVFVLAPPRSFSSIVATHARTASADVWGARTRAFRGHGESVLKFLREHEKEGRVAPAHWMRRLAAWSGATDDGAKLDPQRDWLALHTNITKFLETVPPEQHTRIRDEDLLRDPDASLRRIVDWLGLRNNMEAIEMMKHPEQSPFACFGPPGARYGNDPFFLKSPALRASRGEPQSLDGPLKWREGGQGFLPKMRGLAQQFGYE